ncbi:hypothetical protein [Nostoc sp.]
MKVQKQQLGNKEISDYLRLSQIIYVLLPLLATANQLVAILVPS